MAVPVAAFSPNPLSRNHLRFRSIGLQTANTDTLYWRRARFLRGTPA
jgi:hypothetical protein